MLRKSILLLSLFSTYAFSNATEVGKITRFQIESSTVISVWLDGPNDLTDCPDGARWSVTTNDALYQLKSSLLLTAYTTNKSVTLTHITGWGCSGPQGTSNNIYAIRVED